MPNRSTNITIYQSKPCVHKPRVLWARRLLVLGLAFNFACATPPSPQSIKATAFSQWIAASGPWPANSPDAHRQGGRLCEGWTLQEMQWAFLFADETTQAALQQEAALCLITRDEQTLEEDFNRYWPYALASLTILPRRTLLQDLGPRLVPKVTKRQAAALLDAFQAYPDAVTVAARSLLRRFPGMLEGYQLVPQPPKKIAYSDTIAVAFDFSGRAHRVYWRLADAFVAGLDHQASTVRLQFIDYPATPLERWTLLPEFRHGMPSTWIGPLPVQEALAAGRTLSPLAIRHIGFFTQDLDREPAERIGQSPERTARMLVELMVEAEITSVAIFAPLDNNGHRQVQALLQILANSPITVVGVRRYQPDLSDLTHQAGMLYGLHRYNTNQLNQRNIQPGQLDGILQQDATIVLGPPDKLPRIYNELKFVGSNFQVFFGDYNVQHASVINSVSKAPVVFVDHFAPMDAIPLEYQTGYEQFLAKTNAATGNNPYLLDLVMFETGQLATMLGQEDRPNSFAGAAGLIQKTGPMWELPQFALQILEGKVQALDSEWLRSEVRQKRYNYLLLQQKIAEKERE